MDRATGRPRCGVADNSQSSHIVNWALAVISGRDWVVDAPQSLHRHRVRPAVVFPFLTSVFAHIPHRGRLSIFFTTHAFTACAPTYIPATTRQASGSYTHFFGLNPFLALPAMQDVTECSRLYRLDHHRVATLVRPARIARSHPTSSPKKI